MAGGSRTISAWFLGPKAENADPTAALLGRAELDAAEYRQHGLFVLRTAVMSPYHVLASETGGRQSLLECLHEKILEAMARAAGREL